MVKSFHPSRGKGKVKYKKEENPKPFDWGSEEVVEIDRTSSSASEKEEKPKSFDWDAAPFQAVAEKTQIQHSFSLWCLILSSGPRQDLVWGLYPHTCLARKRWQIRS